MKKARERYVTNHNVFFSKKDMLDYFERMGEIEYVHLVEYEAYQEMVRALSKIYKYHWRGTGPSGCDNHCIPHPCGPCATGLPNPKAVAKKALTKWKELENKTRNQ